MDSLKPRLSFVGGKRAWVRGFEREPGSKARAWRVGRLMAHSSVVHSHTALKNLQEAWVVDCNRLVMHNTTFQLQVMFSYRDRHPPEKIS